MKELKCPKCGSTFSVDEADYALLLSQVKNSEFESELRRRIHELEQSQQVREQLREQQLQSQIQSMQAQLQQAEQQKQLAVAQMRQKATEEYMRKEQELAAVRSQNAEFRTQMEQQLKAAQEQIAYYKDMKLRLSTKMVGETLEQHCATEFARIRPLFPNATKHKNEDFLKKLDEDRRKKGCEYAVLVSLLEPDSELYNGGIVDMNHRFEKMYVIRPQFFVPLITLLCQTSRKSLDAKRELALVKAQQIDVTNFEEKLNTFKEGFARNVRLANDRFAEAIDEIDKTIAHLQKVRENLVKSGDNLNQADKKLQDVTIKRLTYNNPTMKAKFEEVTTRDAE